MHNLPPHIRYALRQFRQSPVFTAAAILTLALGIGSSTALFTLIDVVVLRSLPVADPARLYRIGDGDDCCVEGSTQSRWGMYSFQLYQRPKVEAPEFEEPVAFQAGAGFTRLSVRRQGVESAARPLHSEFVTGNYFSTLGVSAFGGRLLTPNDDKSGALPAAVLSYRIWADGLSEQGSQGAGAILSCVGAATTSRCPQYMAGHSNAKTTGSLRRTMAGDLLRELR